MSSEQRNSMRSSFFSQTQTEKELKTIKGTTYEVRQPSVDKRNRITKACQRFVPMPKKKGNTLRGDEDEGFTVEIDSGELQILSVLECVYVPGTDTLVFEPADREALLAMPTGGAYDQLAAAALRLMNLKPEEAAKNSEATASGSSSFS